MKDFLLKTVARIEMHTDLLQSPVIWCCLIEKKENGTLKKQSFKFESRSIFHLQRKARNARH